MSGGRKGKRGGERCPPLVAHACTSVRSPSLTVMPQRAHRHKAASTDAGRRFLLPHAAWVRYTERGVECQVTLSNLRCHATSFGAHSATGSGRRGGARPPERKKRRKPQAEGEPGRGERKDTTRESRAGPAEAARVSAGSTRPPYAAGIPHCRQLKKCGRRGGRGRAERVEAVANIRHAGRQQQHSCLPPSFSYLLPPQPNSLTTAARAGCGLYGGCRLDFDLCAAFFLAHR